MPESVILPEHYFTTLSMISVLVDIVDIKKYRIVMSRLRMSPHRLEIEVGRWRKPQNLKFN
jgi:hypothetical protein